MGINVGFPGKFHPSGMGWLDGQGFDLQVAGAVGRFPRSMRLSSFREFSRGSAGMAEAGAAPENLEEPCGAFCAACEDESWCPHAYSGNCMAFYQQMDIPRSAG